ncbi:MAG TPA: bifunctional 2-C-methyl-D-erythritol 4-phosphate cytidylyltransferase/2-C-methyl-D-erythritol 2,4-cyclodiphosphate synthase [Rhizomicrobium sp.]
MSRIAALIVAAGRGERAGGGVPKQYRPLLGRAMLRRSIDLFARRADIMGVQVVIGAADQPLYVAATEGLTLYPTLAGGHTRQHSVMHGLEALAPQRPDFVLIHDAARPLASQELIGRVIAALEDGAEAVVPLLPVGDTLKLRDANGVWHTVPRDGVYRAQTPQGFRYDMIQKIHRANAGGDATDDMALAEKLGLKVGTVAGEETNVKVTTAEDFQTAERLLLGQMGETRTGYGFDAHRFTAGDHVWLCGVKVAHTHGLEGHSDADAGLHALTDAILGALGAGDIGQHFPPSDEKWRGASSDRFLAHAAKLVGDAGGAIVHCDVTLICEAPKIGPHRETMRARIAQILNFDVSRVSVKATTTEGMGFTGRREGLAAQAVATIRLP